MKLRVEIERTYGYDRYSEDDDNIIRITVINEATGEIRQKNYTEKQFIKKLIGNLNLMSGYSLDDVAIDDGCLL